MAHKFQEELTQRAEQFIASLRQAGIDGAIVPNSFRDYTVKVSIRKAGQFFGNANLFYSPTKDRFSLKTHELKDASIVPDLERCWDQIDSPGSTAETNPVGGAPHGLQVYVDGSFIDGKIGYAFVILQNGAVVHEHYGQVQDDWLLDMHQVGGEIKAVLDAIAWCQDHSIMEAEILYDFAGLELWATGQWEAKKPATQKYARFAAEWPVAVRWRKIESHTGDHWNERADELAKKGTLQQKKETLINQDPMATVQDKAREFIDFVAQRGIAVTYKGIMNGQFARIGFDKFAGYMDIYNTKARSLNNPYIHGFTSQTFVIELKEIWREFLTPGVSPPGVDRLAEVRYYYEALEPYSDCDFEFADLDQALRRAFRALKQPYPAADSASHDFAMLRDLFMSLQQETV